MSTRAELLARLVPRPRAVTMLEPPSSVIRSSRDKSLPPLLFGEDMEPDNRRLEYPPKAIGYEQDQKKAEDALRRELYEDDFMEPKTPRPAPSRRRSSTLRPDAPVFTPTKASDNDSRFRVQPVVPRLNPANRFRANNKDVAEEAFDVTPRAEKSKARWEGSDDSGTVTPKGPPTWLEKMEVLVGSKLKLSPYERNPVDGNGEKTPKAPQVAIPRYFDSPHPRK